MEVRAGANRVFLDALVVQSICENIPLARDLRVAAAVCKATRESAEEVAGDGLLQLLKRMHVLPLRHELGGSRISQMGTWSSVISKLVLWYRADAASLKLSASARVSPRPNRWPVACMADVSGNGRHATAETHERMPDFCPDAFAPGIGALEFNGRCSLETLPFVGGPLKQPLTLVVVAKARGDTTLCDSLTSKSQRFELCHGYPTLASQSTGAPEVVMTAHGAGTNAPAHLLRGSTRSNDSWHVYTAIYDGERSAIYLDGVREASGRSVGTGSLDGLRVGCDHTSTFFLKGAVAELRLFSCHLSDSPRAQIEAALALRYGLHPPKAATKKTRAG